MQGSVSRGRRSGTYLVWLLWSSFIAELTAWVQLHCFGSISSRCFSLGPQLPLPAAPPSPSPQSPSWLWPGQPDRETSAGDVRISARIRETIESNIEHTLPASVLAPYSSCLVCSHYRIEKAFVRTSPASYVYVLWNQTKPRSCNDFQQLAIVGGVIVILNGTYMCNSHESVRAWSPDRDKPNIDYIGDVLSAALWAYLLLNKWYYYWCSAYFLILKMMKHIVSLNCHGTNLVTIVVTANLYRLAWRQWGANSNKMSKWLLIGDAFEWSPFSVIKFDSTIDRVLNVSWLRVWSYRP